ncbi:MAG: hypothetical protein ACPG5B_09565 [Chitinophagales bacterium]
MTDEKKNQEKPIKVRDKILIGGLGALTPIIMNLLVVDLEKLLINLTTIAMIAYTIKVILLFYIGGVVAYLNRDENKPFKLFQLGIYAPAMIIAFMNTNPLSTGSQELTVPNTPKIEIQDDDTKKEKKENEDTNAVLNASNILVGNVNAALRHILPDSSVAQNDTMSSEDFLDLMRVIQVQSGFFVAPVLEKVVATNAALIDTLREQVANKKKQLDEVNLRDPALHEFRYPTETPSEQFLRGFFGWKSERLWYVVAGKFDDKESAMMYAKYITKELNKTEEEEVIMVSENLSIELMPKIFVPYNSIVPEYCVVLGANLTYQNAQVLQAKILGKGLQSVDKEKLELWKLPY